MFVVDYQLLERYADDSPQRSALRSFVETGVPTGTPFLLDDDWTVGACTTINAYLIAAGRQRAYASRTLRNDIVGPLRRLLEFVRLRHDFPVELTETTTADLVAYRDHRAATVKPVTWANEVSILSGFFFYAVTAGWMTSDPFPRWGAHRRNTLVGHVHDRRTPRCLTETQLQAFLELGLRADEDPDPPAHAERDYLFGLCLAATGLRREEAAFLLDCELPPAQPSVAVSEITRYGKGHKPRRVLFPAELLRQVDLYRRVERQAAVASSQRVLRRRLADGELILADIGAAGTDPEVSWNGQRTRASLVGNDDRARLVRRRDDGTLEPLGLFVGRFGTPPAKETWNKVFAAADRRVVRDAPDAGWRMERGTTPHALRHTYAVRMLAALMTLGRERASDPYHLLAHPIIAVQQLLGHASAETTYGYLQVAEGYDSHVPTAVAAMVASRP